MKRLVPLVMSLAIGSAVPAGVLSLFAGASGGGAAGPRPTAAAPAAVLAPPAARPAVAACDGARNAPRPAVC
jgi:hypothetical protein